MIIQEHDEVKSNNYFKALIFLMILIFTSILILFFASNWRNNQKIRIIEVAGNQALTKKEIIDYSLDTNGGKNRGDFNLSDLKLKVESHPFIYKADVLQKNNDELLISVQERKPFASLINHEGMLYYIDKEGKSLPYSIFSKYADVPIIRNAMFFNYLDSVKINKALQFINLVDSLNSGIFYKNISEIVFNQNGSFYLISSDAGIKILMPDNIENNNLIKHIDLVWRKLSQTVNLKEVSYVDLRWKNRIIAGYSSKDTIN